MTTATTLTLADILAKIQNGTATADEIAQLGTLYTEEQKNKKKSQEAFDKVIADIAKAKIDPVLLFNTLKEKSLITVPVVEVTTSTAVAKIVIVEEDITTKEGRASKFKIWIGREVNKLTADAKAYWTTLQAKGKDYFVSKLNKDGKAYYETEDGKKWIDSLFPAK